MLDEETKTFIIDKLKELYYKQFYEDKKKGSKVYVERKQCFLDLISFFENNL